MAPERWPVIGHRWAVEALERDIAHGRLGHAYLFTGPEGIGKRTLANAFAQAILCQDSSPPCGACRSCALIAQDRHPDVRVLTPVVGGRVIKSARITIDAVRQLIYGFSLRPVEASRRVALCTEFEFATAAAANALLKTLEEPPGDGILMLTAASEELLPPTIVSRCERLSLRPLPQEFVQQALIETWSAPAAQAGLLARLAGGRLGWAVHMLTGDDALERRAEHLEALQQLLVSDRAERFAYADRLARDREALQEALELWQTWWRDVCLAGAGANAPLVNVDQEAEIRTAARQLDASQAAHALSAIRETLDSLGRNANPRLALEVLLLALPSVLRLSHRA